MVSLIPLTFFVFLNEKNIRLRREKKVKEIRELKKVQELNNTEKLIKEVSITSENGKEKISFCIDNLVYVTSQGNYASFFIKKDDKINEKILRVTLAKIIANELGVGFLGASGPSIDKPGDLAGILASLELNAVFFID